jgi:hypothetical protein
VFLFSGALFFCASWGSPQSPKDFVGRGKTSVVIIIILLKSNNKEQYISITQEVLTKCTAVLKEIIVFIISTPLFFKGVFFFAFETLHFLKAVIFFDIIGKNRHCNRRLTNFKGNYIARNRQKD